MKSKAKFVQVLISAELRTQGLRLLEHLISKHLIFGGPVLNGPARFLWKNEIVEHDYSWIITFTREDLKDELIKEAEVESAEAICMITFTPFEGSPAMQALLEEAFAGRESLPKPRYKEAVAALTFVPFKDLPTRTISSRGDLSQVQPADPTR
ncbi:MAG: hypothetical protein JOY60_00370 [Burkholderiaceae bacterium]|nr:hypothetical protein [Burkholderiaceae bacterium]